MTQRILIVEDEFLVAADLQDSLERLGYEVVGVTDNAADAIRLVRSEKPDLALLDVRIRGKVDGIELSGQLDIPFVFLTAHADAATLDRAAEQAPFGYLLKPFEERELQATMAMALRRFAVDQENKRMARWLSTTLECLGEGVVACDADCRTTFINKAAQQMTGWPRREALARSLHEVVDLGVGARQPNVVELVERARAESRVVEFCGRLAATTPGARPLPISASVAPIKEGARILGVVVLLRDRSLEVEEAARQRDVEASVREAQRLQSIGLLASGVAQSFNSLWTRVASSVEQARYELPEGSVARDTLAHLDALGERGSQLATQLLAFSGRSVPHRERFDVNRLVLDHVELLRVVLPPRAELLLSLDQRELHVFFDRGQLRQVLLNLVHNAGEALLETPGTITLSTRRTSVAEIRYALRGGTELLDDDCVELSVSDSGTGIAPELLPNIFDPFFSTRGPTRGLGLAAVDGIVRSHHGALGVHSQLGKGSTFSVYFAASTPQAAPVSAGRTCRVLVVDDDSRVRATLGAILTDWGAVPLLCATGLEAIAAVSASPSAYELALVDLNMPGLSGLETVEQLRALAPQLKLGLLSGYGDTSADAAFADQELSLYIQKPFSRGSVREKLALALTPAARRSESIR